MGTDSFDIAGRRRDETKCYKKREENNSLIPAL